MSFYGNNSLLGRQQAQYVADYVWSSSSTGGDWSVSANWSPNGVPTTSHTALLANATANRVVTYNSSAPGALSRLLFTQTSEFLNQLWVQRSFAVTNPVVLGAAAGSSHLLISGTAASITPTFAGGVVVNAGGILSLGVFNPAGSSTRYIASVTTNVSVNGGRFELAAPVLNGAATSYAGAHSLNGSFALANGTLHFYNNNNGDRRLTVNGNCLISGGHVTSSSSSGVINSIQMLGADNFFTPQTFDSTKFSLALSRNGNQTFSGSSAVNVMYIRNTGVKTVANTGTITSLQFIDESATLGSRVTLKLASNITTNQAPVGASFSQVADSAGNIEFGIDADAYTLDFSASNVWTPTQYSGTGGPVVNGNASNTIWALAGTSGTIRAHGYNFANTGPATLTTIIGPNLVLEAVGSTTTNILSGSGTIDPTSTFRFAGSTIVPGTPATLSSDRALGNLEVISGALRLGNTFTSMQNVRIFGGSLDLSSKSLTVPSVQITGGTIINGTLISNEFLASAGSVTAVFSGGGSLTKTTSDAFTLSGTNTYTGETSILDGILNVSGAAIIGATASKISSASFTNTSLTVNFNTAPVTGETYRLFPGSTVQTYGSVILTGIGITGRTASYNSANSTLTIA